jgi:serine protease
VRSLSVFLSLLAFWCVPVAAAGPSQESNPVVREPRGAAEPITRLIVGLRAAGTDVGQATVVASGAQRMAALVERTRSPLGKSFEIASDMQVVELQAPLLEDALQPLLRTLREDPLVAYAEPDRRRYRHATPNDPLFTGQWYLQSSQPAATAATSAWDSSRGSNGVAVAVLDTGVRFDHPDLSRASVAGRLLPGYDFVSGDTGGSFKTANDGDGRDADPTDPGDWVSAAEATDGCGQDDSSWHGTRVAGIIGARTDNAIGIAGLTWRPWILPVRVLGKCGGFDSDIIAGMRWAAGLTVSGVPANPYPARVVNLSLGSGGACSAAYQAAINDLTARGAVVVASAGNESGLVASPANCVGVVSVVALRHVGTKVGFSNLGAISTVGAPGGNCVNVGAGQPCLFSIDTTTNAGRTVATSDTYTDQFNFNVGTSFSAPIVAGITALMLSVNGRLTSAQVTARLREGAAPYPAPPADIPLCRQPSGPNDVQSSECACSSAVCGAGMANATGALVAARRPIAAVALPGSVTAGQNFTLQGGVSAASCGRSLGSHAWSVLQTGTGGAIVSGANAAIVTAVAPTAGTLRLRLVVTDDAGAIDSAEVQITPTAVTSAAPNATSGEACPVAFEVSGSGGDVPTPPPAPAPVPVSAPAMSGGGGGGVPDVIMLMWLALWMGLRSLARDKWRTI